MKLFSVILFILIIAVKHISSVATSNPQPQKNIVFFGSSTIALWNTDKAFPGYSIKKLGYGGKSWSNLVLLADTISKLNPKQVVLYCGDNDIVARKKAETMVSDIQKLCNKIWLQNPGVHITYLYTKPSDTASKILYPDNKTTGLAVIEATNKKIAEWGRSDVVQKLHPGQFSAIDTYTPFLTSDHKSLDRKNYQADGLHLNHRYGYQVLNRLLLPKLLP